MPTRFVKLSRKIGFLAVLMAGSLWADTVQRKETSSGGGTSAGSGQKLESTIGQVASLKFSGGANNAYSGYLNTNHAPATITTITALTGVNEGQLDLTWTAPGADGFLGTASSYILRFSTQPITSQTLFEATQARSIASPQAPGSSETYTLTGLQPGTTYYVAIEARDAAKNQAALSNAAGNSAVVFATPPSATLDLAAGVGAAGGQLLLTWTSAGDDGAVGNLNPGQYRIDYSTDSGHVFAVGQYQVLIATIAAPGSAQSHPLSGLTGNATFFVRLFTGDDLPVFSPQSNMAVGLTRAHAPAAAAFSGASSTTFAANWLANNNAAGTEYYVELSTHADFSVTMATAGWTAVLSAGFAGLQPNEPYFVRVKARNAALLETAFTDLGSITLSFGLLPPTGFAASSGDRRLALSWNPVFSGIPTGVRIYRSTVAAAGPFSLLASVDINTASYADEAVVNGQAYHYRVASFNDDSESVPSTVVSATPLDALAPQGVAGIQGAADGSSYVVRWPACSFNADGSPMTDLGGYRVYAVADLDQAPVLLGTTAPDAGLAFADAQGAALAPRFYFVRAVDTSGNESIESPWTFSESSFQPQADASNPRFDYFWVAPDRRAFVQVPNQTAAALAQSATVITWKRFAEEENGKVAASYEIVPVLSDGARAPGTFKFPSTRTKLTFRYTPIASAAGSQALAPNTVFKPEDLAVFHHNGIELVKIGGKVDAANNSISVVSRVAGRYIVKQTLRATSFVVVQTAPRKIFTPNGDGVNDSFQIFFENPNDSLVSFAKVFDLTGAEVADLQIGTSGGALSWDGRDRSGDIARGGVYLYQIESEGKTWNGTIVLAK